MRETILIYRLIEDINHLQESRVFNSSKRTLEFKWFSPWSFVGKYCRFPLSSNNAVKERSFKQQLFEFWYTLSTKLKSLRRAFVFLQCCCDFCFFFVCIDLSWWICKCSVEGTPENLPSHWSHRHHYNKTFSKRASIISGYHPKAPKISLKLLKIHFSLWI